MLSFSKLYNTIAMGKNKNHSFISPYNPEMGKKYGIASGLSEITLLSSTKKVIKQTKKTK